MSKVRLSVVFFLTITVITKRSFCLSTESFPTCRNTTGIDGYSLIVDHGQPSSSAPHDRKGFVPINASVISDGSGLLRSSHCSWTFIVEGTIIVKACNNILDGSRIQWPFSNAGLKEVTVTLIFFISRKRNVLRNCTFVDVTDCFGQLALEASTSKRTFNVSKNHSEITLDSPAQINFTASVHNMVDPFDVCHQFYYNWSFGDGNHCFNSKKHVSHFYNSSGAFNMVLSLFHNKHGTNFYKNISLTVHVKEKPSSGGTNKAVVDITLVLVMCLAGSIVVFSLFIVCRKKLHKLTEVASFDFRYEELQSSFNGPAATYKQGCFRKFTGRKRSHEHILLINSPVRLPRRPLPVEEL